MPTAIATKTLERIENLEASIDLKLQGLGQIAAPKESPDWNELDHCASMVEAKRCLEVNILRTFLVHAHTFRVNTCRRALNSLKDNIKYWKVAVQWKFSTGLLEAIGSACQNIVLSIQECWEGLKERLAFRIECMREKLSMCWNYVCEKMERLACLLKCTVQEAVATVQGIFNIAFESCVQVFNSMVNGFAVTLNAVKELLTSTVEFSVAIHKNIECEGTTIEDFERRCDQAGQCLQKVDELALIPIKQQ